MNTTKMFLLFLLIIYTRTFYSKHYRKCKLFNNNKLDLGAAKMERVPQYAVDFNFSELTNTTLPLNYTHLDFIYDEYIDAGGSGEVYRIQNLITNQVRVIKRFFKQDMLQFQQQNYVMHQMQYDIQWHKQDNNPNKSTLASYPSKQSVVLRDLQIQTQNEVAVIFYKLCREMLKAHKKGIIHDDMKMGNILIHSIGQGLRTIDVQLIDWNLATFYSKGYQSNQKKGTVCYYAPESLLRTNFATPAIDIWALAVVYFTFITDKKPFPLNCKNSNLEAILGLVGVEKFLKVFQKYNKASSVQLTLTQAIKNGSKVYQGISLKDRVPVQYQKMFDAQLIDLFEKMLEVDPEYRLTIVEVLNHPYFDRVKKFPKMYEQKNKKKAKQMGQAPPPRQAPADNLVAAEVPSDFEEPTL